MQAGARDFAHGAQAGDAGGAVHVRADAAAGIVRAGRDRHGLRGDVDAMRGAQRRHGGKVPVQPGARPVRDVQVHVGQIETRHLGPDRARHDVARRQFRARVVRGHEALAARQAQHGAFAAQRLGHQAGRAAIHLQRGGMELHEFHVRHLAARAPGHGHAVAGRGIGVGGLGIDLSQSARRQHRMAGQPGRDIAVVDAHPCAEAAPGRAGIGGFGQQQIQRGRMFDQPDVGPRAALPQQRGVHGPPGGVGRVGDAARAVAALARQVQRAAILVPREGHAESEQPVDRRGALRQDAAHGVGVAQPGAGDQRVLHVRLDAVVRRLRRRDAALRPGAGAIVRRALAQHGHAQMRRQRQGGGHAGQAGADDEHVCRFRMHGPVLRPGRSGGTARRRARSRRCCAPAGEPRRRNPACVRWAGARPARWPDPA